MKIETVKGFNDYTEKDALKRAEIKKLLVETFEKYGFNPAETPLIEYEEFVKGGNASDEAVSDIFKLQDKGKRKLAMRYEFTFQLKRLMKNKKLPFKRYQIGEVFRDEPVSANRFRQFVQCDVDVVGSTIKDEAEILSAVKKILDTLKIKSVIYVNNRKLLNEIISDYSKNSEEIIREIDKLDKLSEKEVKENLKKFGAEKVLDVLKQKESEFKKYQGYKEIEELRESCKNYGIKFVFAPFLARGLSYYTGNIFEIKSNIKESICGGGTYEIDGNKSTGISFSIERLMAVSKMKINIEKFLVVSLGKDKKAIDLVEKLRGQGKSVSIFYGKPSKALEYANAYGIQKVVFVGAQEIKKKVFKMKDMITGREKTLVMEKRKKGNLVMTRGS